MSSSTRLFQPLKVGHATLEHRVAMAPLTRFRADENHVPGDLTALYYAQRGSAGGTLLVTEATLISPRSGGYPYAPGLWSSAQVEKWKTITAAVHEKKSVIFAQLWALGRVAVPEVLAAGGFKVQAPSEIPYEEGKTTPTPLTKEEIDIYIKDYAIAARNAIEAGFDGVEIHGANGYLIDQFFQDVSNNRTDEYGGSIENRSRFGLEVTKAVIDAVGDSKKVAIRLSPYGTFQGMGVTDQTAQFSHIVSELKKFDLAYLSVIESREGGNKDAESAYSNQLREHDALLEIWGQDAPVMFAGGFDPTKALRVVDEVYPDHQIIIAFGRYFISTPDIVQRLRAGTELNTWDRNTFYAGGEKGYTDYPFAA